MQRDEKESATNDIFAMLVERDNRIAALSTRLEAAESALQQGEEERETFLAEHDENVRLHTDLTATQAKCEALEARVERIRAFAEHDKGCGVWKNYTKKNAGTCTCGLSEALTGGAPKKEGE